ncbi:GIY-YIG nuclease family protein [Microcoleus sp. AT9_B4]
MLVHRAKVLKLRPGTVPGYVYLVQAVGTDKFKIGRAVDVARRIRGLQTGSPLKIRYVYHAYFENANLCEMELHNKFSNQREIGEWFALTQEEVKFCILLMRLVQDAEPIGLSEEQATNISELRERILQLQSRGYGKAKIILEIWGASKGGSEKYKTAEAEYKRLMEGDNA